MSSTFASALLAPLPQHIYGTGGFPSYVLQNEFDFDATGLVQTYQPGGPVATASNAFFQSLGSNGRSCATCHQPPNGMSVSVANIDQRYSVSGGTDPIFDPVDGSDCPDLVPAQNTSGGLYGGHRGLGKRAFMAAHSLILKRGVFRIFLPVPANAEYTISVVSDPTGCNLSPTYGQVTDPVSGQTQQIISVFRRPRLSTNLGFLSAGSIMADGREPSLTSQAIDATLGHAQALTAPTSAQVAQMVQFESAIYSAQGYDYLAGILSANGATGGPVNLYQDTPPNTVPGAPVFTEFANWTMPVAAIPTAKRQSIIRGQAIFQSRTFTLSNVAGLNDIPFAFTNPATVTCTTCHNQAHNGNDRFPAGSHDLGVAGDMPQFGGPAPAPDLPIFQLTCPVSATVYNGVPAVVNGQNVSVVTTNDPGVALISGKCADIGKFIALPLRALASHPPYFTGGIAPTIDDVVNFYNTRFSIGLSTQEHTDLVNFLSAL